MTLSYAFISQKIIIATEQNQKFLTFKAAEPKMPFSKLKDVLVSFSKKKKKKKITTLALQTFFISQMTLERFYISSREINNSLMTLYL